MRRGSAVILVSLLVVSILLLVLIVHWSGALKNISLNRKLSSSTKPTLVYNTQQSLSPTANSPEEQSMVDNNLDDKITYVLPAGWVQEEYKGSSQIVAKTTNFSSDGYKSGDTHGLTLVITGGGSGKGTLTIDEVKKSGVHGDPPISSKDVLVGGHPAVMYVGHSDYWYRQYWVVYNGGLWKIVFGGGSLKNLNDYSNDIEKIISSVKFK